MNAFATGSRVYGVPSPPSDLDLVVRVDERTARLLWRMASNRDGYDGRSVRFGSLNLIICTTDDAYIAWRTGTMELTKRAAAEGPVDRPNAVKKFQELFKLFGVTCSCPSGGERDLSDVHEALSEAVT